MQKLSIFFFIFILSNTNLISEPIKLTLKEALVTALKNNRNIRIEEFNVEKSGGEITKQKGLFDPLLRLESYYTEAEIPTASTFIDSGSINEEEFNISSGIVGRLPTGTFYNIADFSTTRLETDSPIQDLSPNWFTTLRFSIGQDLLRDFGLSVNLTGVINAKRSGEISINELIRVINDTFLSVEIDYWTLVATIENLELQHTALEVAKDLQRRNEIQVEVGVLPPVAVTQAKSEVAARRVDVLSAENLVDEISDRLKNKLLLPLAQNIVPVDTPEKEFKSFDENSVLKQSLSNRPEVKQALLNIDNTESTKKFYSNQRLPRLSVQGVLEFQGLSGEENENRLIFGNDDLDDGIPRRFSDFSDSIDQISDGDFITWSIVGVFSYPIFNWEARGEYVKARADYNRSIVEYDKIIDDINLEVRSALRGIENSQERIQAAEVSVELRNQVVINEEERLNVGIGTTREVLEAQRDLVDATSSQIRAIADYNIALARLDRARGTIIRNKGIVIE